MKKIKDIIIEEINTIIKESNWNFHFTRKDELDPSKKYSSDNKFQMLGRDTGHFGSGTYFSSYQGTYDRKDVRKYIENENDNPQFIKIDNHVYRVDLDIYKNLYRVESKREGDILYTLLANVNALFNMINYKNYERTTIAYQKILINSKALGLKCPSFKDLVSMAKEHEKSGDVQSFSTYFMEYNGFNGVNVSGINYYDSTTHGSVIYDLTKLGNNEIKLVKNIKGATDKSSYSDTLATDGLFDDNPQIASLNGEFNVLNLKKLIKLDDKTQFRLLKNYTLRGNILDNYEIEKLNERVLKRYMKYIFMKKPNNRFSDFDDIVYRYKLLNIAYKNNLLYWINYIPKEDNNYKTGLISFLENFDRENWMDYDDDDEYENIKKGYLANIEKYLTRDLTEDENKYINNYYS